ncbi:hypothetical protein [Methylorubrum zatmanii]
MSIDNKAARVMADCVRAALLDVVRVIRETDFTEQSGPDAAAGIARSVEKAADLFHRRVTADLDAEASDATA